jgi:hypothetical protein
LWVGPLVSPETEVALTATTVLDLCSKQSLIWLYYFLFLNATYGIHIGTMNVHVQYICEKWFCKKFRRCFQYRFQDFVVPHRETVHGFVNKLRYTKSFLD